MYVSFQTIATVLVLGVLALPAASGEREAAKFYEDAVIRFESGDFSATIIQLKNALEEHPEHPPAQILMGQTYLGMGEPAAAEGHLLNAREMGADEALIVLPLAQSYLGQRKYKEVILNLRYSGYAPDIEYRLKTYQGQAHTALGELDRAVAAYRDAQRIDSIAPEPLAGEALVLLLQGSVELARTKARVATERDPKSPVAWQALAAVSHAVGDLNAAVEEYGLALSFEPDHIEARLARATILMDLGRDDEADADIENVRKNAPFEPRATYLKSVLLKKSGDRKQAKALMSETAQLLNAVSDDLIASEVSLQLLGGLANFSLEAYEQAEGYLNQFLANRPQDQGARRMLASIFLSRKSFSQAVDVLEPVLERAPNDPRVLQMLATGLSGLKRHAEALPLLERAVLTSRGSLSIRTDLAFARLALSKEAEAIDGLRRVLEDAPSHMQAGMTLSTLLLRRGEFDEVIRIAKGLLQANPKNIIARNLLATAQFRSGKRKEAKAIWERIAKAEPGFIPTRVNLAKIDLMEGRRPAARDRLLAILQDQPEHAGMMLELARMAEQDGELKLAVEWVEKALAVQPKSIPAVVHLIRLRLNANEVDLALRVAKGAESWAPNDTRIMLAMARVQLANKRPDIAKALLERLSTAAGYNTSRLMQIANLQVYAGALDAAAWSLKKAVDSDTSHVPAHVELIATLIRLERYDAAMAAAEALRAAAPDKAASFGALGEVLAATSRHDEALEQFRKAHELGANELTATKFALAQGRVNQVVADDWLTQWVKDNPEHRLARRMLAERHLQKGDYELAQSDYEQLVKWHSADAGVFNNYAHILKRLGDPRALEIAERAQELAPNDPNINDTLGWMLVEAGDPQRGLAFLRNAHSRAGLNPAIRYHIAVALSKLDRRDEAQRELQRALASPRSFREREQAEELLRTMSK